MKATLLQMPAAKTPEAFSRSVPTVETNVNFTIEAIANEDGSNRLCQIDRPNPGRYGGHCRALLTPEHVEQLIVALTVWKLLP
jgi:hypothetical protein